MIQFHHVFLRYGPVEVLSDINLQLSKGEFVILLGPSGAGKTALLSLINRSRLPNIGQVLVEKKNIVRMPLKEIPRLRQRIGVICQGLKLLEDRTVQENLSLPLLIAGWPKKSIKERLGLALSRVSLWEKRSSPAKDLCSGERQRLAIARAIITNPPILLADEPLENLDPILSEDILNLFNEINQSGTTILLATQKREVAVNIAKRVVVIKEGRIQ
ncbi:MAG: ATP-binding cassette domain-containing protein [bacterium]|nr:ATP-binding cassette domain-containing protein [bacterium]